MTKTIQKKSITIIIAITATIALLGLSSIGEVSGGETEPTTKCVLNRNILADPLRVNIVPRVVGFHFVIMEKEIYDCIVFPEMAQQFPRIIQTTLLIQQDEKRLGQPKGIMKIEEIRCFKDLEFVNSGPICDNFGTPPTDIPPLDCSGDLGNTEAFVDMDSASYNWFQRFANDRVTTKTIIVEKEILDCVIAGTLTPVIADVFTIEEKVNGEIKFFKWVVCAKDRDRGILGCIASDTP